MTHTKDTGARVARWLAIGCGTLVVVALAAFAALVVAQPSSFRIARTRTVSAPPDAVRALVSDVARFEPTLALGEHAPSAPTVTRSEETRGRGAWFQRVQGAEVSRFELVEVAPARVSYAVSAGARSRFVVELDTIAKRALWPFVGLDARVGPELEQSLEALERALAR